MKSISEYGETILELSEFVKRLDESVRPRAFDFLLARELGMVEQKTPPNTLGQEEKVRAVAPQELLRRTAPTSYTDKAVVLAYWLEKYQQRATFSSSDLKAAFEQAREQSAKNPSDMTANMEATARIMKAEKVGPVQHYRLTSTAIADVENWLNSKEK